MEEAKSQELLRQLAPDSVKAPLSLVVHAIHAIFPGRTHDAVSQGLGNLANPGWKMI